MASTYSTSLKIQLIGNGDQSGTWGTTTNTNWNLIEQAVAGVVTITMTNADYTLSNLNGVSDEARNAVINVGGTNSDVRKVIIPLVEKSYTIVNNTGGGYDITVGGTSGSYVTVPNGGSMPIYCDGVDTFFSHTVATTPARGDSSNLIATTAFVNNALPSGMIMIWYGSVLSIPTGWVICDGTNSTPDLRNRFVLGAGNSYAPGATGGSTDSIVVAHTHGFSGTTAGMNANNPHSHTINDPGHAHAYYQSYENQGIRFTDHSGQDTYEGWVQQNTTSSGTGISINSANIDHGHTFSGTTASSGSSGIGANMPPYYALVYVMKV